MRRKTMLSRTPQGGRKVSGRISRDTKGPPGIFREGTGLWDGQHLAD
jgi:hypothetical protein